MGYIKVREGVNKIPKFADMSATEIVFSSNKEKRAECSETYKYVF